MYYVYLVQGLKSLGFEQIVSKLCTSESTTRMMNTTHKIDIINALLEGTVKSSKLCPRIVSSSISTDVTSDCLEHPAICMAITQGNKVYEVKNLREDLNR